jgi:hypothetical protein
MGREARCNATINGVVAQGRVLLETDALIFRGEERATIPYREMQDVRATGERLTITWPGGRASFHLGSNAPKWEHSIRNPKSLVDKLGIKPDHDVVVLHLSDERFVAQIRERAARVTVGRTRKNADALFYGAGRRSDLDKLAKLKTWLKPNGALWVIRPKGGGAITESDVLSAGKKAGLVDVKVVRFSDVHTAEKFVIPVADRAVR